MGQGRKTVAIEAVRRRQTSWCFFFILKKTRDCIGADERRKHNETFVLCLFSHFPPTVSVFFLKIMVTDGVV